MECEISKDGLRLEWYLGNRKLRRGDKYDVIAKGTVHKLVIEEVDENVVGEYRAVYENLETKGALIIEGESLWSSLNLRTSRQILYIREWHENDICQMKCKKVVPVGITLTLHLETLTPECRQKLHIYHVSMAVNFHSQENIMFPLLTITRNPVCFSVPPEIGDHKYKDKLTITAGSNTSIDVPFTGCPRPEVKWTYRGGRMPDTRRSVPIHTHLALTHLYSIRFHSSQTATH